MESRPCPLAPVYVQPRGIRQGCPLSPYLFIIMMSVLFHDVDNRLRAQGVPCNNWSIGKPVYDLEYADDTALMAVTLEQLQEFLHAVEVEASLYNMMLNKDKTELLVRSPTDPTITFANGDPVPRSQEIKFSWTTPPKTAIKHRVAIANASFSKLHHVWCSKLPWKSKSRVFQSSIVPSLEYSLETCPFDKSHHKTLKGIISGYSAGLSRSKRRATQEFLTTGFGRLRKSQFFHRKESFHSSSSCSPNQ